MLEINAVFHRTQETPWNTIDNEAVVLNLDNGHYYVLNETGRRVWELLDGERTIGQIAALICEEYEAQEQQAQTDIVKLLEEMLSEGLVASGVK
ncbi:MAG: PqqD family peptide modification chaperone [Candidatus Schekmanbacteria bacterium]|nr:PqqD family peptide modification chaperone [Candidatus Schekmanbacteria bacterium]